MEIKEEISRVLHHYDLGDLKSARQMERGYVNDNWIVETTHGRYFFKRRHPDLRKPDIIRAQHALIKHLRHFGFPVPAIITTTAGQTLLVLDNEFYEIQEFIEGTSYQHNKLAHFERAARTLGHYHACVQGFEPLVLQDLGSLYDPTILTVHLTDLKDSWELRQDPARQQIIQKLASHAGELTTRFARHDELPFLVIHGDYHAGNLIFDGDRIVGVVDFDKASWRPRVVELAEVLIYFASLRPGHLKHLVYPGFLKWDKFARYLRFYALGLDFETEPMHCKNHPRIDPESKKTRTILDITLKESEVFALPDYICCIWLSISLQNLRKKEYRPLDVPEALGELLALCDWSAANRQNMIEITCKAIGRTSSF
jgi:homoserine kinase type II